MSKLYKQVNSDRAGLLCFELNGSKSKETVKIYFEEVCRLKRKQLHGNWDKNCFMISETYQTKSQRNLAMCIFCKQIFEGRPTDLFNHIASICTKINADAKLKFLSNNSKLQDDTSTLATSNSGSVTSFATVQPTISNFVRNFSKEFIKELQLLLLKAIITSATTFSILNNEYFKQYQRLLAGNNAYPIPSYYLLIQDLLPQLYVDVTLNQQKIRKLVREKL